MQAAPTEPAPTERVIALARRGNEAACRALVDHLLPTVVAIVRNHLPRREEEEDLTQEVFMKVFARLDRFAGGRPIAHWVSRITINTCYDRLRRQRVRPVVCFAELNLDETEFLERATGGEAEQVEVAGELLEKLLGTLSPHEGVAIRLLDLDEHTVREVCMLTGWGESKVKVTAMRARRKLRAALRRLEGPSAPGGPPPDPGPIAPGTCPGRHPPIRRHAGREAPSLQPPLHPPSPHEPHPR